MAGAGGRKSRSFSFGCSVATEWNWPATDDPTVLFTSQQVTLSAAPLTTNLAESSAKIVRVDTS